MHRQILQCWFQITIRNLVTKNWGFWQLVLFGAINLVLFGNWCPPKLVLLEIGFDNWCWKIRFPEFGFNYFMIENWRPILSIRKPRSFGDNWQPNLDYPKSVSKIGNQNWLMGAYQWIRLDFDSNFGIPNLEWTKLQSKIGFHWNW